MSRPAHLSPEISAEGGTAERRSGVQLPPEPSAAGRAREWILQTLTEWDATHLLETAALLTDELVVNSVRHAKTPMLVRALWNGSRLRIEVTDACPAPPVRLHVPVEASSGRGMHLVATLSCGWGVQRHQGGKTVWFEAR